MDVIQEPPAPVATAGPWTPQRGPCADALSVKDETIKDEAVDILSRCVSPAAPEGQRTGLVIGHVQSGKTSSFTAVSAFARDNGFNLIIMISGVSTNLYEQSAARIERDLSGASLDGWVFFRSSSLRANNLAQATESLRSVLNMWNSTSLHPSKKPTVVWSVMKETTHLTKMLTVLEGLSSRGNIRALIIDDEADQASLNFRLDEDSPSTIYGRLTRIRELLPHVTYLQYTATPQANLLVRLEDVLSPQFCVVLTPGMPYTGGATFHGEASNQYVKVIPDEELAGELESPPDSLVKALRHFYLCISYDMPRPAEPGDRNRSMMIHPAVRTISHTQYERFVRQVRSRWRDVFGPDGDAEERAEEAAAFREVFEDYAETVADMDFDDLMSRLPEALEAAHITVLNQPRDRAVNWSLRYHIVIGAKKLERGFTVEGLAITYMPRRADLGSLDNVQQRARWFGYKEGYLGLCRVYMTRDSREAYRELLRHEEDMRQRLRGLDDDLRDIRRVFRNDSSLALTRRAVIGLPMTAVRSRTSWVKQTPPEGSRDNKTLVEAAVDGLNFIPYDTSRQWTLTQSHMIARDVPSARAMQLLQGFKFEESSDASRFFALELTLEDVLSRSDERFSIVKMSANSSEWRPRVRDSANLHMGRQPSSGYAGDVNVRDDDGITIQVHKIEVPNGDFQYALAVWVPARLSGGWVIQDED